MYPCLVLQVATSGLYIAYGRNYRRGNVQTFALRSIPFLYLICLGEPIFAITWSMESTELDLHTVRTIVAICAIVM
jgi:hypothetical protein